MNNIGMENQENPTNPPCGDALTNVMDYRQQLNDKYNYTTNPTELANNLTVEESARYCE